MSERELEVICAHSEPRVRLYTSGVSDHAAAYGASAVSLDAHTFPGVEVSALLSEGEERAELGGR